ncbi:hypothetical protein HY945_01855 [Candidatus Gottesmanbacteria bacterium]|nr:hypothetical protein [Candidatus Gottesmanbacteria bacterium]
MRFEKLVIAGVILVSIFLTKFPTFYHALNTPKNAWFVKQASWFDAWDVNAYVSYIRYGERNGMMLVNTYTTIPHSGVFVFQYYTFLGILNRFLHLNPFLLFHLASIITDIGLILVLYFLAGLFITKLRDRLIIFLLIVLGGGLGWLPWFRSLSAEVVTPDFNFIKPFNVGHDAFIILLSFLSLGLFYYYLMKKSSKHLILAVISGFGAAIFHPYKSLWFGLVGAITAVWRWKEKWHLLQYPFFLSIIFLIYFSLVYYPFLKNPGFAGIVEQVLPSINIFSLILGFGLLIPFIIWQLFFSKNKKQELVFIEICFLTQFFLLFLPVGFARLYIPGIYVCGAILAYYGMKELIKGEKIFFASLVAVTAFSTLSTFYVFNSLLHIKATNPYFFLTKNEGEALGFMSKLPADSGVLSLYRIGNFIPAFTDNKVYFGHFFQTPGGVETLKKAQIFYTAMNEEEQRKFISDNYIQYIYYGLEEANLRKQVGLSADNPFPYFSILYRDNGIILYGISKTDTK